MTTKAKRTEHLLQQYRGLPGEFYMLKGILCLDNHIGPDDAFRIREKIDTIRIAERMDELNREARDAILNPRKHAA